MPAAKSPKGCRVSNALLQEYVGEREGLTNTIKVLEDATLDRKRSGAGNGDLSDADLETITRARARITKLDEQIEAIGFDPSMPAGVLDKLRMSQGEQPLDKIYRTSGEMLWDCVHAAAPDQRDHGNREAAQRWDRAMKRAAQHMGTTAAATTATAGGFGGFFVNPVVGPVLDLSPKAQPFLTAIGKRDAPNAMTFLRPRIVDPNFKTGAGVQALQKAELTSVKFDVAVDNLNLQTVGGYLNVSQQLLSLQPQSLDIIVSQMQARTAWQGEALALLELAETTAQIDLEANVTDAAVIIKALYDAAALVYTNTGMPPEWIAYGVEGWARLGSLVDAAKRPLFPFLGAGNALGTGSLTEFGAVGPLGLRQIVTPGITNGDIYLGNSISLEAYAYPFPVLEAVEPSVLGRQVAVAEALAFHRPITTAPSTGNGAVRIAPEA